jgi:hypothetical protein
VFAYGLFILLALPASVFRKSFDPVLALKDREGSMALWASSGTDKHNLGRRMKKDIGQCSIEHGSHLIFHSVHIYALLLCVVCTTELDSL